MALTEASAKSRDVPNAADAGKDTQTTKNKMGHPEQTVTQDGEKKRVLNELDPEEPEEREEGIMDNFDLTARRNLGGGRRGKYQAAGLSQLGDENLPDSHNESRGSSMNRRIDETVQDQSGVSGDFMEKMGGKTDRLGASQKNTGGAYEKHSESSSGSPDDGVQTAVGKGNLIGAKQKNTGGSPEEFADSGTADAKDGIQDTHGDMAADLGQNEKQKNKGGSPEPMQGSKNKMSEDWTIDGVASIMEEDDINIQELFDGYAREASPITLEEFEILAKAHGCTSPLDEDTLEFMMTANREFIFYENEDDTGRFWMAGPITEGDKPFPGAAPPFGSKDDGDGGDGGGDEGDDKPDDGDGNKCETCKCDPCTCESAEKGEAIKERRFGAVGRGVGGVGVADRDIGDVGGAGEAAYDPFAVDLDRAIRDPGYTEEYPEIEPEVGPQIDLDFGAEEDFYDDTGEFDTAMGEEEPGMQMDELQPPRQPPRQPTRRPTRRPRAGLGRQEENPLGISPYEGKKDEGQTISEMTGTAGIAAPPMGTAISRGTRIKRKEPIIDVEADKDEQQQKAPPMEGFQQCAKCGGLLDRQGCPTCALMRETHELGVEAPDPSTDAGGHFTTDATTSGLGDVSGGLKGALTNESGSTKPDDGITTELGGMGSDLGQNEKQKNKGGQHEPLEGGGAGMQENVVRMAKAAKKAIQEGALSIRKNGKFGVQLVVQCEGIKPKRCNNLTEALVNTEELIQAYGHDAVQLEAHFFNSDQKILAKKVIPVPTLTNRGPVVCESRCIFRYAEVANDFADQIVSEGTQCKVNRHNWGASVAGKYDWDSAQKAFGNIPAIQESTERPS